MDKKNIFCIHMHLYLVIGLTCYLSGSYRLETRNVKS